MLKVSEIFCGKSTVHGWGLFAGHCASHCFGSAACLCSSCFGSSKALSDAGNKGIATSNKGITTYYY